LINATGGTGNLTIQNLGWDLEEVYAGNYSVIIMDEVGCQLAVPIAINEPTEIQVISTITAETGLGANGIIELQITGGQAPYTIWWSNGTWDTNTLDNLESGTYNCQITDALGCNWTGSFEVPLFVSVGEVFGDSQAKCRFENGDFCYSLFDGQLYCIDSMGRLVYSVSGGEGRVMKEQFPNGTYFWVHVVGDQKWIYTWMIDR
jgi:hypothetical protein